MPHRRAGGVERTRGIHPDVLLWLAAIDKGLDENAYTLPSPRDADEALQTEGGNKCKQISHDLATYHQSRWCPAPGQAILQNYKYLPSVLL